MPIAAFLLLVIVIDLTGFDVIVADWLFALEGHEWVLRDNPLTRTWLHDRARILIGTLMMTIFALGGASLQIERLRSMRRGFAYLATAIISSVLLVLALKHLTGVYCPWDYARYGGNIATLPMPSFFPVHATDGICFPAGHASSGYSMLALYFFLASYLPRFRWLALGFALTCGLLFGMSQELRGAHFLSHDLWSLTICWTVCAGLAVAFRLPATRPLPAALYTEPS